MHGPPPAYIFHKNPLTGRSYIDSVIPGSSAERAGIRRGDIITSFNGRAVFNMDQLVEEIGNANVGDTVDIMILREGRDQLLLQATLGENTLNNF